MAKVNFKSLLSKIKQKPKDKQGKFKDRAFAKEVSAQLALIRKSRSKQTKLFK